MIILDEQETTQRSSSELPRDVKSRTDTTTTTTTTTTTSPTSPSGITTSPQLPPPYIPTSPGSSYPAHHNPYHNHQYTGYSHHPADPTSPTTSGHSPSSPSTTAFHTTAASNAAEGRPLVTQFQIQQEHEIERRTIIRFFTALLTALVVISLSTTLIQTTAMRRARIGSTIVVQGEEEPEVLRESDSLVALLPQLELGSDTNIPKPIYEEGRILSIAYPPPH